MSRSSLDALSPRVRHEGERLMASSLRRAFVIWLGTCVFGFAGSAARAGGDRPLEVPTPEAGWDGPALRDGRERLLRVLPNAGRAVIHVDRRFGTLRIVKGAPLSRPLQPTAE